MQPIHRRKLDLLKRCTFLPGSWPKRFTREMAALPDEAMLSAKQEYWIDRLYFMYRKQIQAMDGEKPECVNPAIPEFYVKKYDESLGVEVMTYQLPIEHPRTRRKRLEAQAKLAAWNRKVKP